MVVITQKCWSQLLHGHKNPTLSYSTSQNTKLNQNQSQALMWVTSEHNHCMSLILVLLLGEYRWGAAIGLEVFICAPETANEETGGTWVAFSLTQRGYNSDWETDFEGLQLWRSSGNYLGEFCRVNKNTEPILLQSSPSGNTENALQSIVRNGSR